LKALAFVSVAICFLSACPLTIFGIGIVIPLSLSIWFLARRDLARMQSGEMDPHGENLTDKARDISFAACLMAVIVLAWWVFTLLVLASH
jgi:hypothetical protein